MPSTITLQPGVPSRLEVAFRPLLAGEAAAIVTISAPQLGPLRYGLRLLAAAAAPLRLLSFDAVLGSSQSQVHLPSCHAHSSDTWALCVMCIHCMYYAARPCALVNSMLLRYSVHAFACSVTSALWHDNSICDCCSHLSHRMAQVLRIMHWALVKAEYRVSFQSGTAGEFYCASASISAPAAGPGGSVVEVEVYFEPTAVAEDARDVLLLSSPIGGAARHQHKVLQRS